MTMIEDTRARPYCYAWANWRPTCKRSVRAGRSGWRTTRDAGPSCSRTRPTSLLGVRHRDRRLRRAVPDAAPSAIPNSSSCRSAVFVRTRHGCSTSRTSSRCRCRAVPPFRFNADLDRKVVAAYGMVMLGESVTETNLVCVRHRPGGVLRAVIYYPLATGATPTRSCAWWTHCSPRIRARWRPGELAAGWHCHRASAGDRGGGPPMSRGRIRLRRLVSVPQGRSRASASRGRRRGGVLLRPRLV